MEINAQSNEIVNKIGILSPSAFNPNSPIGLHS